MISVIVAVSAVISGVIGKVVEKVPPFNVDYDALDAQDRARSAATRNPKSGFEIAPADPEDLKWVEWRKQNNKRFGII